MKNTNGKEANLQNVIEYVRFQFKKCLMDELVVYGGWQEKERLEQLLSKQVKELFGDSIRVSAEQDPENQDIYYINLKENTVTGG